MAIRDDLADFCARLEWDDLPQEVVAYSKLCFLDQLALIIGGSRIALKEYPNIIQTYMEWGGEKESTVAGVGKKIPALHATLVNTFMGANAGFDAIHKTTMIHLPAVLFPPVLAVAELRKAGGKEFLLASVTGGEVMARVGLALGARNVYQRGFHPTSVCAAVGCATAIGKIMGLSCQSLAEALSIACVQCAGSSVWEGPVMPGTFPFQMGKGAQSGVLAAILAEKGLDGVANIFEHPRGYLASYSDQYQPEMLIAGLGERYEMNQISLKRFSAGEPSRTSIDALLNILEEHKLTGDDIAEIYLRLPTAVLPLQGSPEYPQNRAASRVNARYVLAATANLGNRMLYNIDAGAAATRNNPGIVRLFNKINVLGDPELDKIFPHTKGCIVRVITKDGAEFSRRNDGPPKGDPANPLSQEDVETKLRKFAEPILGRDKPAKLIAVMRMLEDTDNLSTLTELLTP